MRVSVTTIVVAAIWATAGPATAEPWTRSRAVDRAMEQNPQVTAQRAEVMKAAAQEAQASAARRPWLSLTLGVGPSWRAELVDGTAVQSTESSALSELGPDDLSVAFGGQWQLIQPLYTFGKIALRRSAAQHGQQARKAQTDVTRADVALAVATLYEQYLFARDAALFFEEIDHTLTRSIEATRDRLDAGKPEVSEQDLLRLEAAQSLARVALHQAQAGIKQAEGGLRAYLGVAAGSPFEVAEKALEPLDAPRVTLDRLIATGLKARPELNALRHGARAYRDLAAARRADGYPDVFLAAGLSVIQTPGRDELDTRYVIDPLNHVTSNLLLGMRWTWQWGMQSARAAEKQAEVTRLLRLRDWAQAGIPAEIEKAHQDMQRALKDLQQAASAVKGTKQWMVRASADYTVGLGDSRSVTDAVQAYTYMRLGVMDARLRLNLALAELDRATGNLSRDARFYR